MYSIINIGILLFLGITIVHIHAKPTEFDEDTSDSGLELNSTTTGSPTWESSIETATDFSSKSSSRMTGSPSWESSIETTTSPSLKPSNGTTRIPTTASSGANNCNENEEYNSCGSACAPTCDDVFYPRQNTLCTAQCISGCFCKSGLYRTKDGRCVQADGCCPGPNEVHRACGTACPESCKNEPQSCTKQCVSGCFCKANYIRADNSTNSTCIESTQC